MNFEDMIDDLEDMVIPETETPNDPPVEEAPIEAIEETPVETIDNDEDNSSVVEYFNALTEYGVLDLPEDFEFDGTPQGLQTALEMSDKQRTSKIAADLWERLPEDFRPLLQYALNGGKSLSQYLDAYGSEVDYSQLDLSDETNQRKVLYDYYKTTSSYNEEKINRMINRLADIGDLEDEALDAVKELVDHKEQQRQNLIIQAAQEEQLEKERTAAQTQKIQSVIETSVAIAPERKNRVKAFMFNPVKENGQYTTQLNQTMGSITSNPEHLVQLADILADYHPSTGFSFDRIEKKLKTKDVKSFKDLLDQKLDPKASLKGSNKKVVNEDFDWDGFLNS